jgi:hypothetical protein
MSSTLFSLSGVLPGRDRPWVPDPGPPYLGQSLRGGADRADRHYRGRPGQHELTFDTDARGSRLAPDPNLGGCSPGKDRRRPASTMPIQETRLERTSDIHLYIDCLGRPGVAVSRDPVSSEAEPVRYEHDLGAFDSLSRVKIDGPPRSSGAALPCRLPHSITGASFCTPSTSSPNQALFLAVPSKVELVLKSSYLPPTA